MTAETGAAVSLRDVYGKLLVELGQTNPRIAVLDADLSTSTRTGQFKEKFPSRYLNVGIAEQNMVGIAAGIALGGGIPFVNTFAAFLTRRAADQIAISVAYPRLNVKFFGFHAGINLGEDGATQQAVEDLGIMQSIPGIQVFTPVDSEDLAKIVAEVVRIDGPTYVRLSRFPTPVITGGAARSEDGYYEVHQGSGLLVLVPGTLAADVLAAARSLGDGAGVRVIAVSRVKPLSDRLARIVAQDHGGRAVVVEEHNIHGGLADAVSSALDRAGSPHLIERIGVPDRFGESGPPRELLESFELAGAPLADRLKALLRSGPAGKKAAGGRKRPASARKKAAGGPKRAARGRRR